MKIFLILASLLVLINSTISCSNTESPVESSIAFVSDTNNRSILAVYDAVIDPDTRLFTVTPIVQRSSDYHFPLTIYFPDVLQITGYGWTPDFWADIKLKHPFPGSDIKAYDPRIIAILPANPGVSFEYPVLNVNGNHSVVLEPDGYTKLFDHIGGSIPGNVNPFKAYFKSKSHRVWSGRGVTEETQRWEMKLSGFGGPMRFKLVVDVSTNYPHPPQVEIDNAPEPVQIEAGVGLGLTPQGGSAEITVTILDWQGRMSVGDISVEAPDLFNGTVSLTYLSPSPDPDMYIYTGTIENSLLAPQGEHKMLVAARDSATGICMYDEFPVYVVEIANGLLLEAKSAGGSQTDTGKGITTLSDDSTVVTGSFIGTATFGPGEANQRILNASGESDIFIARYNTDQTLAWVKRAGGSDNDYSYGITTLSDNTIVAVGTFRVTATFGPGEPNQTALTSAGSYDIFIARYNEDGTLVWAKRAGGSDSDSAYVVSRLSDNSIIVIGKINSTATFGKDEINETVLTSAGLIDAFVARYNPDGTLAWVKRAGGVRNDIVKGSGTHPDNSTVFSGWYENSITFAPGETNQTILTSEGLSDIFIARYNPDGTLAWAKNAGGTVSDNGNAVSSLSDNSTIVSGYFGYPYGSATFGKGEINETTLISAGEYNIFIARYNPDGTLAWAKRIAGDESGTGLGITTISNDAFVLTGWYMGEFTFGEGEPEQTVLKSTGSSDIFVARYVQDGSLVWAKSAGGLINDTSYGITALSDDSTVVTGIYINSAVFGPGELNETTLISKGVGDIFVAHYAR